MCTHATSRRSSSLTPRSPRSPCSACHTRNGARSGSRSGCASPITTPTTPGCATGSSPGWPGTSCPASSSAGRSCPSPATERSSSAPFAISSSPQAGPRPTEHSHQTDLVPPAATSGRWAEAHARNTRKEVSVSNSSTSTTLPAARWRRTGLLLFLVYLVAFAERANISVAAPAMSADLHLAATATGVVLSAFFWGYILTQVPGGWLANKIGPSKVIAGALLCWGVVSIGQALSDSTTAMIVWRFLMGLSEGVVWPAFAVMFVVWFPLRERARAAGLSLFALPASSIVMVPSAGWLIETWDWRVMFVVQGLPAFVLAFVVLRYLKDSPEQDARLSEVERDHILATRAERATGAEAASFWTVLKSPAVWACCVVYFLWLTGFYSFGLWLPTVVGQLSSRGIGAVGLLSVIPFAVAGVAMLLNSRAADRSARPKSWFVIPPLVVGGIALLLQQLLPATLGVQLTLLVVTGIGVYAAFGPWWAWALQYIAPELAGQASGMINLMGSLGGVVGPVIVGFVATEGHAASGLYVLGFSLLVGALVASGIARLAPRNRAATTLAGAARAKPTSPERSGEVSQR
ncbi:MFS transporter [Prauserella sp. PE36]|nr:MFS transporter [Prauserella sp. PE36]